MTFQEVAVKEDSSLLFIHNIPHHVQDHTNQKCGNRLSLFAFQKYDNTTCAVCLIFSSMLFCTQIQVAGWIKKCHIGKCLILHSFAYCSLISMKIICEYLWVLNVGVFN